MIEYQIKTYGIFSSSSRTNSSSSMASLLASRIFFEELKRSSRKASATDFELKLFIRLWSSKDIGASEEEEDFVLYCIQKEKDK